MIAACSLCKSNETQLFYKHAKAGDYYKCKNCDLIFLKADYYATTQLEKEVYLQHTNELDNSHYLDFISPVVKTIKDFVNPKQQGLDYGCGYSPLLATLLYQDGFSIKSFDPMFFPHVELLTKAYDYVVCTEVVEHFKDTKHEWEKLNALVKPGGHIVVMTLIYDPRIDFSHWHYRRDPTHVSFYTKQTMQYISENLGWTQIYFDTTRLFVFQKN